MTVHLKPFVSFDPKSSAMLTEKLADGFDPIDCEDSINKEKQHVSSSLHRILQYDCLEVIEVPQKCAEKRSNFSIDYILGISEKKADVGNFDQRSAQYDWLNYTRYKPPKLQRKSHSEIQ